MKTERILGALYGQALGDAMGMPSELWPRSRVKAHFGWIDRFLPGPKENNAACYFNRVRIHRRYLDGAVSGGMRYWNVKARSIRI